MPNPGEILLGYFLGLIAPAIAALVGCLAVHKIAKRLGISGIVVVLFMTCLATLLFFQMAPYLTPSRDLYVKIHSVAEYGRPTAWLLLAALAWMMARSVEDGTAERYRAERSHG